MTRVRPGRLAHQGVVRASGTAVDLTLVREPEARRRILAAWSSGTTVLRTGNVLVALFPEPRRVQVERAPGAPLVLHAGAFLSAPLTKKEISTLAPPPGSLVLVRAGLAEVAAGPFESVDPADWIDVSGVDFLKVTSLGAPPGRPVFAPEARAIDLRGELGGIPAASSDLAGVVAALRARKGPVPGEAPGFGSRLRGAFASTVMTIAGLFDRWFAPRPDGKGEGLRPQARPSPISAFLRRLAARFLVVSKLAHFVGRKHAEYIGKMMDMFERGDTLDALRHAIPLSSMPGADGGPLFGAPAPRSRLDFSLFGSSGGAPSVILEGDLFASLRKLYRSAFQRLEAMGRIDEAVFVLVELLEASEEAVSFLERHGRLKLAAELAEARQLAPGLVVRQWFVAGDVERAVRIARRHSAFADALSRLENSKPDSPELTRTLRLLWADALAEGGNWGAAVETAWQIPEARRLVRTWIERGLALEGPSAGRLLARQLALFPESFASVRDTAVGLLSERGPEGARTRLAFTKALLEAPSTPESRALARPSARALLRDAAVLSEVAHTDLAKIVDYAQDRALRTDMPELPKWKGASADPVNLRIAPSDRGRTPVHDAVFLASGKTLAALGESGVRLLSREGRELAPFDVPATRLVISDSGASALALAPRGDVWRISRIDLATRLADSWCDARLTAFAEDFDGSLWFAADGDELLLLDTRAKRLESFWHTTDVGRRILSISRSPSRCRVLTEAPAVHEWIYELPAITLRSRDPLPALPEGHLPVAALSEQFQVVCFGEDGHWCVRATWRATGNEVARIELGGVESAQSAGVRLSDGVLTVCDLRGRIVVVDLVERRVVRDLRV